MNKHDFFLDKRSAARVAFERPAADTIAGVLEDEDPLLRELRLVFDWMAREKNAERIPSRLFKQRLPDIHRKFPDLASSFKRMDADGNCWLDWEEFVTFCVRDEHLVRKLKRAAAISIYGMSKTGERAYKDPFDPTRMCELGPSPPILPWELSHVVEWRVEGLKPGPPGKPLEHAGMQVRPGTSIASPPFRAAGVCGFLRFWPAGYWTESQRTRKCSEVPTLENSDGEARCRPPSASSWCCVGACLPSGTHLQLRFYVGDDSSARRECYWSEGTHVHQLWGPKSSASPFAAHVRDKGKNETMTLVVGIEIYRNLAEHKNTKKEHKLKAVADADRHKRRPVLKDPLTQIPVPTGSALMQNSSSSANLLLKSSPSLSSLPSLAPGKTHESSMASLPKLTAASQDLQHPMLPAGALKQSTRKVMCA